MCGKEGARIETDGARARQRVRRDDRSGSVFCSVDAVAIARQRENVRLASHGYSESEQEFCLASAAPQLSLADRDSRLAARQQNSGRFDGQSVETDRTGA